MEKPIFPHTIDSTMLSTFRACPQKFYRQYIQHWKPKSESVHLRAGAAFAAGVEAARVAFYIEQNSSEDSVAKGLHKCLLHYGDFQGPPESAKSLERTCGALEYYFEQYPLGADGATPIQLGADKLGIELAFAQPLDFLHPVTGDPLLYTGRSDMVADFAGGVYIFDEKTTSSLGQSWSRQWEMRSQFTGYCWGCRGYGISAAGVIVRGVSILKTKYDTMQVITYRADWEVDRWLEQVHHDLARMQRCWETGVWDHNLDHTCVEYGGCSMSQICKSKDPEPWLDMYFEKRIWDPLQRKEMTVEEYEALWAPAVVFGTEEGELCNRDGCQGRIELPKVENCSCHISPPCGACWSNQFTCSVCGWSEE